jgi:putative peptidoglycan lipid II flippase
MARSLKAIAVVVTLGTLLSKVGGLVRQLVIAAAFGVGAAYDAYNYAYVLPGFLLILLGGINGPFHSAMVSVLSRRPREEGAHILAALNTTVSALLLAVTVLLVLAADPLISLVGPGLSPELHAIAVVQLQVMAPMALLAGLIGLGFGSLNAADEFWIPAISPLMSSLALMVGVGLLWWQLGGQIGSSSLAMLGGLVLAAATLVGAFAQWLIQLPALMRQGLARFKLVWDWKHPGVREVWRVMGPATLSSGMLQINVFTDLFFRVGHCWCGSGFWLRQSVGADTAWLDFQRVVGSLAAHICAIDCSRRSAPVAGPNSTGVDAFDRLDGSNWSVVHRSGYSNCGPGVRTRRV